ncbi:MAG TPA: phage holin family protein [Solirubrobacteraceae bacterium]|nr:phage holin family protein [Solirubrobacteraceae bacterium]
MSASPTPPGGGEGSQAPHNIAAAIAEVSERATVLVREEIELAKAEVTEKATKLVKGAIVGIAAGIFFAMALIFALVGCAWLLYYYLPGNEFTYFWGFFAMAVILLLLGALAGLLAAKAVKKGSPPVPAMAIEEAQKIKETVSQGSAADGAPAGAGAPVAPGMSPVAPGAPAPPSGGGVSG